MGQATYCGMISVLVVDDHDVVRRGLASILRETPHVSVIGEAATGEDAIRLARELQPDIVLMDLRMPGMGGLEAARRIHVHLPQTRLIAVTAWDGEPVQRLYRSGFSDCVGKNVTGPELEAVILRVVGISSTRLAEPRPDTPASNPFDTLTGREMQICSLLLGGQRAPDIARRLFITPKTVHTYRYRIFEKLGIKGDIELTKLAASHGLIGVGA